MLIIKSKRPSDVADDFFSQPTDRADLTYLESIQTTALDEENDLWGIAMMSVQANVPNTLPGQAVVFMLLGDVQVENAVSPADVFTPADPILVKTLVSSSNVRLSPTDTGYVLGTVPFDTQLDADGLSENGEWIRVIYMGQPAWIFRNITDSESSFEQLPIIKDTNRTPMQAFYFSTGTGASVCNEAPDSLMIQGPNSLEVQINANGVDINIGSTIVLESKGQNDISITAINGYAEVENVRIPGGFTIDAQTDAEGTIRPETLSGLRPMEDEQIERFKTLEKVEDASVVNYRVQVPAREEITVVQVELERGQKRETIKSQCQQSGLTVDQCNAIVGTDSDATTIFERCKVSGLSEPECRLASGVGDASVDVGDDATTVGDRCRSAGFETVEDCRDEFTGEPDDRIQVCVALGHSSASSCRDAFPEDSVDKIMSCVSRGFVTKQQCDAADSDAADGDDNKLDANSDADENSNQCQESGLTKSQCRRAQKYKECRSRGYTDAQCRNQASGG